MIVKQESLLTDIQAVLLLTFIGSVLKAPVAKRVIALSSNLHGYNLKFQKYYKGSKVTDDHILQFPEL